MLEMDFRLEAAALSEMAENAKADPDFRVPAVDWDRTAKEVLTLEWIDATPLTDRARLQAKGFDLPQLARTVIQTFLRHALRDRSRTQLAPAVFEMKNNRARCYPDKDSDDCERPIGADAVVRR